MKKILLLFILIVSIHSIKAQITYFNYLDYTVQSRSHGTGWSEVYDTDYFDGDTLINSKHYYKKYTLRKWITTQNPPANTLYGPVFIREDSTQKFWSYSTFYNTEIQNFDFHTIDTVNLNDTLPSPGANCTIGIIDTLYLGTRPLRHVANINYPNGGVVEGIGPIGNICGQSIETSWELICYIRQNDTIVFGTSVSCDSFPIPNITTGLHSYTKEQVEIYPNPFSDKLFLSFSETQNCTIVKIKDLLGKEQTKIYFTGKQLTIEKGEMVNGIYLIQILDENKNISNKKIIVQ